LTPQQDPASLVIHCHFDNSEFPVDNKEKKANLKMLIDEIKGIIEVDQNWEQRIGRKATLSLLPG